MYMTPNQIYIIVWNISAASSVKLTEEGVEMDPSA